MRGGTSFGNEQTGRARTRLSRNVTRLRAETIIFERFDRDDLADTHSH